MADISIYIPCYNGARTLARAIESVLALPEAPADIMVIDDGSTDDTAAIAERFPEVRLIRHNGNLGLAAARNRGLCEAKYDWVAAIDADVRMEQDWLAKMLALRGEFPQATGFGGRLVETARETAGDRWRCAHMRQEWGATRRINPPFLFGANILFDRRKILAVGGYDERLRTNGEDVNLAYRLRQNDPATLLVYAPEAICYHMRLDTAVSIARTHWAWYRHPYAVLSPPRDFQEWARFTRKHLIGPISQKIVADLRVGEWGQALIGLRCLIDNPCREWAAYRRRRR
ncbi:MAG: glycosyltransferase family A protein [Alphaproteobacteria bacterium]|nr:glycosyltransferase family A protein [Alphaproteobacteria bacterium]